MNLKKRLPFEIFSQPNDSTCGPTCLHAVYRYFGDDISLDELIGEIEMLESGGTLAVFLANHALSRGYQARIYTYNLSLFDPTWFAPNGPDIKERLVSQMKAKNDPKLKAASRGYIEFLGLGGEICFEDLTAGLIRKYLNRSIPIITGLSSTYLYRTSREFGPKDDDDDIRGNPSGHFVVLCGYDRSIRNVRIADPLLLNPLGIGQHYDACIDRVLCSILLGVITYDAKLLIIEPQKNKSKKG